MQTNYKYDIHFDKDTISLYPTFIKIMSSYYDSLPCCDCNGNGYKYTGCEECFGIGKIDNETCNECTGYKCLTLTSCYTCGETGTHVFNNHPCNKCITISTMNDIYKIYTILS
mgnify:FL=1